MEKEEGEDDIRISELFQRAERGQPFGYRRDVNLLMDVICDRLSSRLCHRCVRQTSHPTCPRLMTPASESCQCQQSNGSDTCVGRLVQGREQITQTLSNRCDSCNATLFPRGGTKKTASKTTNYHTVQAGDPNLREGLLKARDCHDYPDLHKDNATLFSMSSMNNDKTEKPVYIKGRNPLLDKLKYELQNDEETKHEIAKLYKENDIPSPLLPPAFETPEKFENKTVGATRHSSATPVDLLRRRFSRNNRGMNSWVDDDFESDEKCDEQTKDDDDDGVLFTKRVGRWHQFKSSGEIIWRDIAGEYEVPCEENVEVDAIIHRQPPLIPRAARQKGGPYNALEHESTCDVEDRGVQAVPLAYQAQTQMHGNPNREILSSQQETQTYNKEPGLKTALFCETRKCCRTVHADVCTQTSKTSQQSNRRLPFSLNTWTQTPQIAPKGTDSDQRTTTGSVPSQSHLSSDWSTITDSDQRTTTGSVPSQSHDSSDWLTNTDSSDRSRITDSDNLPLNPKNTVELYKQSFEKLNMKLTGDRHAHSSDYDGGVDQRVGRGLESSQVVSPNTWNTLRGSSHAQNKLTHARSFQCAHPAVHDVLSLGKLSLREPVPTTTSENTEEVKTEENGTPLADFLGCYHEYDLAAFFELHHLDVPVSFGKKRGKRVNRQSKRNDQLRSEQMDVPKKNLKVKENDPDPIDERLDHVTSKLPQRTTSIPSSPIKKKPEFRQGALNQFEAKEGTRRLSRRDQAPIMRKKREERVIRQSKRKDQRSEKMDVPRKNTKVKENDPDQIDERLDHVTSKLPQRTTRIPSSPIKKKPEFRQGALNQFEAKDGTRRLSWRNQGSIKRKVKFFETEAYIAGQTKASEQRRRQSAVAETGAQRRISLFEELIGLKFWK